MRNPALRLSIVCVSVLLAMPRPASALDLSFSGVCNTGNDPLGHGWLCNTADTGEYFWGIPGRGVGSTTFLGGDWVTDFHIEFFGLPESVTISDLVGPSSSNATVFRVLSNPTTTLAEWDRVIQGNVVWFLAPTFADRLQPGGLFFVNVRFSDAILLDDTTRFEARWSMDVPEPGALALFAFGLAGLRRFRRCPAWGH